MTILMLGSAVVSLLVEKLGWLLDVAALIQGWTSATMLHDDLSSLAASHHISWLPTLSLPTLPLHLSWLLLILAVITYGLVLFFDFFYRSQHNKQLV